MTIFDRLKRKEESIEELKVRKTELSKEKERQLKKQEIRKSKQEISRLKHPYQEETRKGLKRAGGRAVKFTGKLALEGARSFAKTTGTVKRRRVSVRRATPSRSFMAPHGDDISLSGSIARADWSGGRNVMNTEFFGERESREFFKDRNKEINLTSNKKKDMKYY